MTPTEALALLESLSTDDDAQFDTRNALINYDELPLMRLEDFETKDAAIVSKIIEAIRAIRTDRHMLSELLLSFSLCPMHAIDYAICFDDDDADCATIRAYFPSHDT